MARRAEVVYSFGMRIVIATGIYPPDVGGPAYYAQGLADALRAKGHEVRIVAFSALKKFPTGIRHVMYAFKLVPALIGADTVIALDTFTVALPAAALSTVMRVPLIIRTGGDFLWESYIERTHDPLPLTFFYEKHKPFTRKERIVFALTRWVVRRATSVVFSTTFQRDIWVPAYRIRKETFIIDNAIAQTLAGLPSTHKSFISFGRPLFLKNDATLADAFALAQKRVPDISLETGMVPHDQLMEKIRACYAVIVPSISEVSPNLILDAMRCGKPFILTKYSGFADRYTQFGLICDPLSVEDIANKIVQLCDDQLYGELSRRIMENPPTRTYADVTDDFLKLIDSLKKKGQ